MSRAMNLTLGEDKVRAECLAAGVNISAIEPLPSGGTHLVCVTGDEADTMRIRCKAHVVAGAVKRFPFFVPPSRQ